MQNITKDNAKQHCLTCLVKLDQEITTLPHYVDDNLSDDEIQEFKVISIDLTTNEELQVLLRRYIAIDDENELVVELPHSICLKCYNKFQGFEKFRLEAVKSVERLLAICSGTSLIDDFKAEETKIEETGKLNEDIYKMLLKDTLMETESVLISGNDVERDLERVNVQTPDPFGAPSTPAAAPMRDILNMSTSVNYASPVTEEKYETCDWLENESSDSYDSTTVAPQASDLACNDTAEIIEEPSNVITQKRNLHSVKAKSKSKSNKQTHNDKKRRNKGSKNTFKCDQCNHCFAHKITLDAHIRKVHEGSKKPFQCDRCDKAYTFIGGLYTHIKEVHDVEVRSHACDHPGCERIYTSFVAMQKHKRLKHSEIIEQKKYVCEQCGATFNQSGNLKHHRRTKHPTVEEQVEKEKEKTLYNCDICQKQFHSRYTLKYHTLQLHTDDMKYECNVCGRRMAKKFMLAQHMLVHSTDKMPCEHCGKQFIRKFELEAHIRAVHMKLKPFECQYCSECFASRKTLRHHEYIHTGEKPYVCDICLQGFRQQTCLKNHRKQHGKLHAAGVIDESSANKSGERIANVETLS